jgi:hypothetical protein
VPTGSDGGGNLDGDGSCGLSAAAGSLSKGSAMLGPLQDNGGPTPTEALLGGSQAIGLGRAGACTQLAGPTGVQDTDQRGVPRNSVQRGTCDSGAYDTQGVRSVANGQVLVLDAGANNCTLTIQGGTLSATSLAVNGAGSAAVCPNVGTIGARTLTIQGGIRNQGGTVQAGTISTGQQTADPFAGLVAPSVPIATCPGSACAGGTNFNRGQTYQLLPGHYTQWLNFNSGSIVCLAPGTYYLDGGWNVNAAVLPYGHTGCPTLPAGAADPGVTLYFHTGSMQLNSGATMSGLSAPQSGPYSGLFYWQASRDGLYPNAGVGIGGAWYAPSAALTLNSGAAMSASQVIVKDLTINSGASLTAR